MTESWGMDLIRLLFSALDKAIYTLIATTYEILLQISKIDIFSESAIHGMATKMYTLLGVIMLFKITFSFINYLVDPESLTDKSKGAQKIILNVIIVLVLIIITPTAFGKLREAQSAILEDQVIPQFILGTEDGGLTDLSYKMSELCDDLSYAASDGDYISILIFRPFFQLEASSFDDYCSVGAGKVSKYLKAGIVNYAPGVKVDYRVDYQFLWSTLVGVVCLLILISFCFDIAVRSIKLGFLQIIAPIPIISYVDPKSGKDGMFKKWLKEVGRTWVSLFIRLAALFFAVYIIKLVTSEDMFADVEKYKLWVQLFIIIGTLMFAKKLPKLLEDILGIKLDGGLTLNPMKKIRDNALGGKMITGGLKGAGALGIGAGLGIAANAGAFATNWKNDGLKKALMGNSEGAKGYLRAAGTILGMGAGGISSGVHGAYSAFKDDKFGKGISSGLKTSVKNRDIRDQRQDANYGLGTRVLDTLKGAAGIKTEAKKRSISTGNTIAGLQTAQGNIGYQLRDYAAGFDSDQLKQFSSVSVDDNGLYTFTDENNEKLEWNGRTKFNESDLQTMMQSNIFGNVVQNVEEKYYEEEEKVTGWTKDPATGALTPVKQKVQVEKTRTVRRDKTEDALKYIKLQAESKSLGKDIADYQKKQNLYQKEDSDKKKS